LAASVLALSDRVILRPYVAEDVDIYVYWISHGEWRFYSAPWYGYRTETTPEQEVKDRAWFAERLGGDAESYFNRRAVICVRGPEGAGDGVPTGVGVPIGDVSWYRNDKNPYTLEVGIGICEDAYLNRGLGTEALRLWVDYLFNTYDVHKLGLETWSFNPRMIRAAEKVGFVLEGRLREHRCWQDAWIDFLPFGLLRREWEAGRAVEVDP